ncbi:2396_t:CDS:2, partial [Racocetra fulgida]
MASFLVNDDIYECYEGYKESTPYGVTGTNDANPNSYNVYFQNDSLLIYDVGQQVYDNESLIQYEVFGNGFPDDNFVQEIYGDNIFGFYEGSDDGNLFGPLM